MSSDTKRGAVTMAGVGLLAAAVVAYEIALTRIFSFRIWHHFAFMVLSIALLGTAASGVMLQRWPALRKPASRAGAWAFGFAFSALVAAFVVGTVPFDPTTLSTRVVPWLVLGLYYFALAVPFACAGMAILIALNADVRQVARVYAADLVGAGVGAVAGVLGMSALGADGAVWMIAALGGVSATLLHDEHEQPRRARVLWLALPVLCAVIAIATPWALPILPGPGKALAGLLDVNHFPDARVIATEWNAISRVDVVEHTVGVQWTINPGVPLPQPPQTQIVIDGDAATPIIEYGGDERALAFLGYTLGSAAYGVFHPERVLVIGGGGGVDVLTALHAGARSVDAVEVNPTIARLMTGELKERSSGLYERPDVKLFRADGRAFVEQSSEEYDLVQMSLVDTWAATSQNAYSLAEAHLYTVEAFAAYLRRLKPDGVLTMTRWLRSPPRETLRLCVVAARALEDAGYGDAADHIVVLRLGHLANMIMKKSAFTPADIAAFQNVAGQRGFDFVYAPGIRGTNSFVSFFRAPDRAAYVASYPYDISPVSDDRPFFFQLQRWTDTRASLRDPSTLSGRLVVLAVLAQSVLASIVLLVLSRRGALGGGSAPAYFAAIGLAFMFIEVALVQHATLLLGSSTYALALTLGTLLCGAGIGSALAPRMQTRRVLVLALAAVACVAAAMLLHRAVPSLLRLHTPARVAAIVATVTPVALLMGMAFPLGVSRFFGNVDRDDVNLGGAWAANGCASVVGPVAAALVAMDAGITATMLTGAAVYVVATALMWQRRLRS